MSIDQTEKAKIKKDLEDGRDTLTLIEASLNSMLQSESLDEGLILAMINKAHNSKENLSETVLELSI